MSPPRLLVYGAYGYTGLLVAALCKARGVETVLAGRSEAKLRPIADRLGLEARVFGLADAADHLTDIAVVLHCAGPFARTSQPMVDACMATGTHYLDITGEIEVFEACAAQHDKARQAGVLLMPGVGFDVVPTDCLAAHLKRRLPEATALRLGFSGLGGGVSHGTAMTMVENLGRGGLVRRGGKLTRVPTAHAVREIDFGRGPQPAMALPWGDVSTAFHTTGIPDIEVFVAQPRSAIRGAQLSNYAGALLRSGPVQSFLKGRIDARPAGPSAERRARARSLVWGEATAPDGQRVEARVETLEGYTLTAEASVRIAEKVLADAAEKATAAAEKATAAAPGFSTPAGRFGADLILEMPDTTRTDVV